MSVSLTVVGLGYAGLPVAYEACQSGLDVIGLDTSEAVVKGLRSGFSHIEDLSDDQVAEMLCQGFSVTTDFVCLGESDVVVVCVPTPLSEDGIPDLTAVVTAARGIGERLAPDRLVVLESTTYPGTTEDIVRPLLENASGLVAGRDFALAYSPERVDPGNKVYGLRNTPKVVGGLTPACTERAVDFYGQFVDTVIPTVGIREAELAKLLENTYRHVNIALMNEMAVFCHELGIDIWSAIEAAKTKPFGFEAFYPGPGIGGHCIPIDPNYLSWVVRSLGYRFRLVELAQEVSERMPAYVAKRVQDALNADRRAINGSSVLLIGVSYKANVGDDRETPARPLAEKLLEMGAELAFYDPHVGQFSVGGHELSAETVLADALVKADIVVLLQEHDEVVASDALRGARKILDTRGVLYGDNVERL